MATRALENPAPPAILSAKGCLPALESRVSALAELYRRVLVQADDESREEDGESTSPADTTEFWVSSSGAAEVHYLSGSYVRNTSVSPVQTDKYALDVLLYYAKTVAVRKGVDRRGASLAAKMEMLSDCPESSSLAPRGGKAVDWAPFRAKDISTRLSTAAEIDEDEAIEVAYEQLYKQIESAEDGCRAIDAFLEAVNVKRFTNAVLLSVLTATAMSDVRDRLRHRPAFYARTADVLREREGAEAAAELLHGLE